MASKQKILRLFATRATIKEYPMLQISLVAHQMHNTPPFDALLNCTNPYHFMQRIFISSVKVKWRKDHGMDDAMEKDRLWRLCTKVVREVLKEPGQVIPLRYLEKRRERLRLSVKVKTFLNKHPGLFDTYLDRIKPKSQPVPFLRPSDRLARYIAEEKRTEEENESLSVERLGKILMMSNEKKINADKLVHVKRDFGFPDDFLFNLVPKYPNLFRVIGTPGNGTSFLELVSSNPTTPQSVIEKRAQEESEKTGRPHNPAFVVRLPPGMMLKKEVMEWTRNWMDRPYISPYLDASHLDQASPEMEKRTVGLIHELLSLSVLRRIPVPTLGKFCDEFRLPNAFPHIFTRHPGIFYLSLKGGIKTAMLREAYYKGELIDKDPLLVMKEKFSELLKEGLRERAEKERMKKTAILQQMEQVAIRNADIDNEIKDDNPIDEDNASDEHSSADEQGVISGDDL
eukprot:Gb_02172 [translate_table: standard]